MSSFKSLSLPTLFLTMLVLAATLLALALADVQPTISDSLAYVYAGQRLGEGAGLTQQDVLNQEAGPFFYLHGFRALEEGADWAFLGYPPGFPVLLALPVWLTGKVELALYVNPLLVSAALVLAYLLGRLGSGSRWVGLWSALLLAAAGEFWRFSTASWSEPASVVFLTAGVLFFLQARRGQGTEGRRFWWALLAGGLIGFSFFIRYTNAILIGPLLVAYDLALLARERGDRRVWLRRQSITYAVLILAGGGVLFYNWYYFGGPLNSIYSTAELGAYSWPKFSWRYALGPSPINGYSLTVAGRTLWGNYGLLLLLALPGWWQMRREVLPFALGLPLLTVGFYAFYAFAPAEENTRFLLPLLPFLAASMGVGVDAVGSRLSGARLLPRQGTPVALALTLLGFAVLLLLLQAPLAEIRQRNENNRAAVAAVQRMVAPTAADGVWISARHNDLIWFYGKRSTLNYRRALQTNPKTGHFDGRAMAACVVETVDALLEQGRPVYFVPESGWEIDRLLAEQYVLGPAGGRPYVEVEARAEQREALSPCAFRFPRQADG